ncbi:4Fe-4S binding protein [bacterium]|nr:4Fe-4S binding protein [bacterium]
MKEIAVISGKGGTGKTSITASFATLAKNSIFADCDVDAADLFLILQPEIKKRNDFNGRPKAEIDPEKCSSCGNCLEHCRFEAVKSTSAFFIDKISCEGCGVCQLVCPEDAVKLKSSISGEWYISDTRFGPLIHAKLGTAEENSGKLVALVRMQAKLLAENRNSDFIIIDGAPGMGCPVISCITGTDAVLVVTEPTVSGEHDLNRICQLTRHFNIPTFICINKYDINPQMAQKMESSAELIGNPVIGHVYYDSVFNDAQRRGMSVVEYDNTALPARQIIDMWKNLTKNI